MNSSTDIESVPFTDVVIDNTPDRAARRLAQCMLEAVQAVLYSDEAVVIERIQPARGREGIDLVISAGGTLRRAMFTIDAPVQEAVSALVRAALESSKPAGKDEPTITLHRRPDGSWLPVVCGSLADMMQPGAVLDALEQAAEQVRKSSTEAAAADEPKMLDRVVARAKSTGGAASVNFEELLQLKNEIESAGGRLLVAGLPGKVIDGHTGRVLHQRGHRYVVAAGAGQGDIEVELDSEPAGTQQAVEAAAKATATAGAAVERAREAIGKAEKAERSPLDKAVSTLCLVAGDEQAPEAARVAALQALGQIGAALAAAG